MPAFWFSFFLEIVRHNLGCRQGVWLEWVPLSNLTNE